MRRGIAAMQPEEAWKVLDEADLICDAQAVEAALARMARDITSRL